MATPPQILAFDLGTSGMKAGLVGLDGSVTGWAVHEVPLAVLPGGGAQQRPVDWWQAAVSVAGQLRAAHPQAWAAVVGVCTSAQGEGTVPLGKDLEPLHDCLLWMDMRGQDNLFRHFGHRWSRGRGATAMRPDQVARWIRYTGGMPSTTGKDPASHMLWFRDERPEVYERTRVFVNVLDYMNLKLTGEVVASVDSILTSWVTDNRTPGRVRYQPDLVARSGIEADKMPAIVPCTEVVGPLTPAAADALGLPTSVQVVAGAIDTSAAAVGAGTTGMNAPHLYLGTSSWIAAHVPSKRTDFRRGVASVPCALPDRYLLTALQTAAGANIAWVRDKVLRSGDPLAAAQTESRVYDLLDEMVCSSRPGAGGVVHMPWIHGERAPVENATLRAGVVNVGLHTTGADMVRAIFEGVAYNTRWLMEGVEAFMRCRTDVLPVAGGGAQSESWCQILADVMDTPVQRLREPVKVNARGAGWIGAVGLGMACFDELGGQDLGDGTFTPRAAHREVYDEGYETFRELYRRLAPLYRRLAAHRDHRPAVVHGI